MVITGNFTFDYSLKNIPNASKSQIQKLLVDSIENFINRMRWKLFWMKSPPVNNNRKETFGFKSSHKAPSDPDLKKFEEDLIKMVPELEMKKANNSLQDQLKVDMHRIKEKKEVIVSADKTDNHYLIPVDDYRRLMVENISKDYKRTTMDTVRNINREAASISRDLLLDDRIEAMAMRSSFITVKDHEQDWPARPIFRLINPTKSNIGVISKSILDRVNSDLRDKLIINHWRNTNDALRWFAGLEDKNSLRFVKFDVEKFYPSITRSLLSKAMEYAKSLTFITSQEEKIIFHARKNVLIDSDGQIWEKKSNPDFDVSMGSMDGAEVSELVGIYMISKLMLKFNKANFGIYRDDGVMVVRGGGPEVDRARKEVIKIFNQEDLKVTTECNTTCIDFLDIIMDLRSNSTRPFTKPNASTKYVSTGSSHPPTILKSIPDGVSRRLSNISSTKELFIQEIPYYQAAMDRAGHKERLTYKLEDTMVERKSNQRGRGVIWFNPPWSSNIRTNVGGKFISLVKKHFPKSSPMHSIFNTKKLKVSYKTTPNMSSIIKAHNRKTLFGRMENPDKQGCNCRGGIANCPMRGECLDKSMIYKAEVTTTMGKKHYYGQTMRTFKERYYGHQSDLRHHSKADSTTLSTYVWRIRDSGEEPEITWSKVSSAKPYSLGSRSCSLCLMEKTVIAKDISGQMLNRRRELMNRCLHKDPHKLTNYYSTIHPQPNLYDDMQDQPILDDPPLTTGVSSHDQDASEQPVHVPDVHVCLHIPDVHVPLHVPDAVDNPDEDLMSNHPIQATADLPDVGVLLDQEPPDPPDLGHDQLRRTRRVVAKRYSCLNMDNF